MSGFDKKVTSIQPVVGRWLPLGFVDGTTSQQTIHAGPCKIGGLIPLNQANTGNVTLSDGTNTYVFSPTMLPIGGLFFAGGIELVAAYITIAATGDDLLVLYQPL